MIDGSWFKLWSLVGRLLLRAGGPRSPPTASMLLSRRASNVVERFQWPRQSHLAPQTFFFAIISALVSV